MMTAFISVFRLVSDWLETKLFNSSLKWPRKLLEFLVVGGCPYCTAIRAILFGYGVGRFDLIGLALAVFAVVLTQLSWRFL